MHIENTNLSSIFFGPWRQDAVTGTKRNKLCAITSTAIQMGIYAFAAHKISQAAFPLLLKQNPLNASNKIFLYKVVVALPYAALLKNIANHKEEHSFFHKMAFTSLVLQSLALVALKMPTFALATISSYVVTPLLFHMLTYRSNPPILSESKDKTNSDSSPKSETVKAIEKLPPYISTEKEERLTTTSPEKVQALTKAIRDGQLTKVKELLSQGVPFDQIQVNGQSAVHLAVSSGWLPLLELLLKYHPNLESKDSNEETPLQIAVRKKNQKMVELLIIEGKLKFDMDDSIEGIKVSYLDDPINRGDFDTVTKMIPQARDQKKALVYTIILAAEKDKLNMVKWILEKDPSAVHAQDKNGDTPLHWAAYSGRGKMMQFLIDHQANTETKNNKGRTPLLELLHNRNMHLSIHECSDLILLLKKTNINATDANGDSAMHLVVQKKDLTSLYHLLQYKPDLNCKNNWGATSLDLAKDWPDGSTLIKFSSPNLSKEDSKKMLIQVIREQKPAIFEMLIEKGVSLDNLEKGCHAIHIAAKAGRMEMIKVIMKKNPGCLTLMDDEGNSVVHYIAQSNYSDLKPLLLMPGINLKAINKRKQTALHVCLDSYILSQLLGMNIALEAKDTDGNTALHLKVRSGARVMVKTLLDHGANINAVNDHGDTPLHLAANGIFWDLYTQYSLVDTLLMNYKYESPNISIKNKDGDTPLHIAARAGHKQSVRSLIQKGASAHILNNAENSPVWVASEQGHVEIFYELLTNINEVSNLLHEIEEESSHGTAYHYWNEVKTAYKDPCGGESWENPIKEVLKKDHVIVEKEYYVRAVLKTCALFRDAKLARRVFRYLNKDQLTLEFTDNKKAMKWIRSERQLWEENIAVHPNFFKPKMEEVIPEPSEHATFDESCKKLNELTEKIQNTDCKKPGYLDIDIESLKKKLKTFLDDISKRNFSEKFTGPPDSEQFNHYYKRLENIIIHLAIRLSDPEDPVRQKIDEELQTENQPPLPVLDNDHIASALKDLSKAIDVCPTGRLGELYSVYALLTNDLEGVARGNKEGSLEVDVEELFEQFRERIVQRIIALQKDDMGYEIRPGMHVHVGLQVRHALADRGVQGHELSDKDPYALTYLTKEKICSDFDRFCSATDIWNEMDQLINGRKDADGKRIYTGEGKPMIDSGKLLTWLKDNCVPGKLLKMPETANQLMLILDKIKKETDEKKIKELNKQAADLAKKLGNKKLSDLASYLEVVNIIEKPIEYIKKEFSFNDETNEWGMEGIKKMLLHPKIALFQKKSVSLLDRIKYLLGK